MTWNVKVSCAALLVTIGAGVMGGCHSYRPLDDPIGSIAHNVKVQFSMPRNVVASRPSGGDTVLALVSAMEGRVYSASRDTVNVSVAKFTDAGGEHLVTPAWTVTVARDPSVAIDVLSLDENKTAVATTVSVAVVSYIAVIVLVAAILASVYHAN